MGSGDGTGRGSGEGAGEAPSDAGVAAGAGIFVGLIVFVCVCGIPMIIAGLVMVFVLKLSGTIYTVGIALLAVSGILIVGGTILVILLCAGVIGGKKNQVQNQNVVMTTQGQQGYGHPPAYQNPSLGGADPSREMNPPGAVYPN